MKALVCSVLVAVLAGSAHAQELGVRGGVPRDLGNGSFSLITENDLFTFGGGISTDRFYSNGIFLHSDWSSPVIDRASRWLALPPFVPAEYRTYLGLGFSHELHTPATTNACAAVTGDPLATPEDPRDVDPVRCAEANEAWARDYAKIDRPFAAVWSVFSTVQRYAHRGTANGPFTQYRLWARFDLGTYGRTAAYGYQVQKNWHGFINDTVAADEPSTTPTGWSVPNGRATSNPLLQASAGIDLNLIRLQQPYFANQIFLGFEIDARARVLMFTPRNQLAAGYVLRAGLLPDHSSAPKRKAELLQPWAFYAEASAEGALVITDLTYGAFDEYRHGQDTYTVGATLKVLGLNLSASMIWERLLYRDALEPYPSTERVTDEFHRYGRVAAQLTY